MNPVRMTLLGDFSVYRDGEKIPLPASKKTRALMAYLALSSSSQRRNRLTELFWDLPDDPKGSLRWSLSKIRNVLNDDQAERLQADRERVLLDRSLIETDLHSIIKDIENPAASLETLRDGLNTLMSQTLLEGLEFHDQMSYSLWLQAEREKVNKFLERHLPRMIGHPDMSPDVGLSQARNWFTLAPYSVNAANSILTSLLRMHKDTEYAQEKQNLVRHFKESDMDFEPVTRLSDQPEDEPIAPVLIDKPAPAQNIRFCKTQDGVSIAYASVGDGPPLVKAANWLSHLELDWNAPIWSPLFRELATSHTFIRYDERGNGLSDWNVPDLSQEAFVKDLEAVVDAVKLERFPLLGISQGAAVSIEYAYRHPERVSKLILFGGYSSGWRKYATPEITAEREAVETLVRSGWGQENPAYRHIFSTTFMPNASSAQLEWFDDFQRHTTSPENAAKFLSVFGHIDVEDLLPKLKVPTLILHSRLDQRIPWTMARDMAAQIPDARLVTLESPNHLLLDGEPAADEFVASVRKFLTE